MPINTTSAFAAAGGTVSSTALALTDAPFSFTDAQLNLASRMRVTCATQPIAYRYDGGTPTATSHFIPVGGEVIIIGNDNIRNFRVIRATGVDGAAFVTLEKD